MIPTKLSSRGIEREDVLLWLLVLMPVLAWFAAQVRPVGDEDVGRSFLHVALHRHPYRPPIAGDLPSAGEVVFVHAAVEAVGEDEARLGFIGLVGEILSLRADRDFVLFLLSHRPIVNSTR